MILIVASKKDVAGMNIANQLIDHYGFEKTSDSFQESLVFLKHVGPSEIKLAFVNEETIWTQFVTDYFSPELLVFVSRHSGIAGIPTLSVHTPGNLTEKAEFGGLPREISVSPASAMKNALTRMAELKEARALGYEVSYECTHHGPSLNVPTMFAELGSSPEQWKDSKAAEVVADAVIYAVSNKTRYPAVLGAGGPHYNSKFTKIALSTPVAFGHIIPKYAIPFVDTAMVELCVQRTVEKVDRAFLDWKGMKGAERERLITALNEKGIQADKA